MKDQRIFDKNTKLFPCKKPLDEELLKKILFKNWQSIIKEGDELKELKASQNITYKSGDYIIRVTFDENGKQLKRIEDEKDFLLYLAKNGLESSICSPIKPYLVKDGDLIVMVTRFAKGRAVDYISYEWMRDRKLVGAVGKWLAKLHKLSIQYTKDHANSYESFQDWDDLHFNLMKGFPIDERDKKTIGDPIKYGITHSDINPSNYFYLEKENMIDVFDWDQVCFFN